MDDLLSLILIMVVIIGPIIVTFLLAKKYKENKFIKYLPSIISFLIGVLLYSAGESKTGLFAGLYELFFAFAFFTFCILAIITALIYEIYNYFAKSKNKT